MTDLTQWSLDRLTTKIQNDLELHAEVFVRPIDIQQFINDSIDDAEEHIVNSFSDFFLTFKDYTVESGDSFLPLPDDIYECRIRGLYFDQNEYNQASGSVSGNWYKVKKQSIENVATVDINDNYQYRIVNPQDSGSKIQIFPDIRNDSTARFRLWYIRKAVRLAESSDILERGLRPQYIISATKTFILQKELNDYLPIEEARLATQTKKLLDSLSRLSDDQEDSYLRPDNEALYQAYGDGVDGLIGFGN